MKNKRVKFKSRKFRGLEKIVVIALLLFVAYFLVFEAFRIDTVIVEGNTRYTDDEIKDYVIKDRLDNNSIYLYLKYKYMEQEKIPFVQNIEIKLQDKNTVKICVYEKVVTGCIEFMDGYMYFDKDGIIVESTPTKEDNTPLVVGLSFTRIALHEQLQIQDQVLFDTILNLTQLINKYTLPVDTIVFSNNLEVTLYCGKSKVLLGKHDFYDEPLSQLSSILASSDGQAYSYDLRNYTAGDSFIAIPIIK